MDFITAAIGFGTFALLVTGYRYVASVWDRVNVVKIDRTKGRVELIGFRYRGK